MRSQEIDNLLRFILWMHISSHCNQTLVEYFSLDQSVGALEHTRCTIHPSVSDVSTLSTVSLLTNESLWDRSLQPFTAFKAHGSKLFFIHTRQLKENICVLSY